MARPIRETPILVGKDAERFVKEMKRVDSLTPEQRRANREKLHAEVEEINKKWNLTYNALLGWIFIVLIQIGTTTTSTQKRCISTCSNYKRKKPHAFEHRWEAWRVLVQQRYECYLIIQTFEQEKNSQPSIAYLKVGCFSFIMFPASSYFANYIGKV